MKRVRKNAAGFSLIELVIVVVIIAIIGAIAIPKMSRGAQGAGDSAVIQDLAILNSAADLYNAEHPTALLGVDSHSSTTATLTTALTGYTDVNGVQSATKTGNYIYGPYLKVLPSLPVGGQKSQNAITLTGPAGTTTTAGWLFSTTTNTFQANDLSSDVDALGKPYNTY
jgi:general secretion pathway protein G